MTHEEAVEACEFWTTNIAETQAWGTSSDPMVGLHFGGDEYHRERWTNPGKLGWTVSVSRWIPAVINGEKTRVENPVYQLVVQEINRRKEEK